MTMSDWFNLNEDLLRTITKLLIAPVDRIRFMAVCKWWQFIAKSEDNYLPCPPPWLMLAENPNRPSQRCFVGLSKNMDIAEEKSFEVDFPEGLGNRCVGSTGTWLIMIDQKLGVHLRNPFTRGHIELPPLSTFGPIYDEFRRDWDPAPISEIRNYFIHKAVLRWHHHRDFVAIAIYSSKKLLSFTRSDSKSWTTIQMDYIPYFSDVIFSEYHDKFYAVGYKGVVVEIDIDGGLNTSKIFDSLTIGEWDIHRTISYLVECEGQVLQVIKFVDWRSEEKENNYNTIRFQVYALDITNGKRTELKSLGPHSLFIGENTSVALLAFHDSCTSFHQNSIYFTDDFRIGYVGSEIEGGKDMGVFDLETGKITPHCKRVSLSYFSPPSWIIPRNLAC